MKIRIKPNGVGLMPRFSVQQKRWYGWETLYNAELLSYCWKYIDDLKEFSNVELVKYQEAMKREEEIARQADKYSDNSSNYAEWSDDGGWSETNDIDLIEKAFKEGATWSDMNPVVQEFKIASESYHRSKLVDWQQVRIQAAIAAMQGILSNTSSISMKDEIVIQESVKFADALVKELKGEQP